MSIAIDECQTVLDDMMTATTPHLRGREDRSWLVLSGKANMIDHQKRLVRQA